MSTLVEGNQLCLRTLAAAPLGQLPKQLNGLNQREFLEKQITCVGLSRPMIEQGEVLVGVRETTIPGTGIRHLNFLKIDEGAP